MISEIKKLLGTEKLLIGSDKVIKELRKENIEKIYVATNLKKEIEEDMKHYAKITTVEIVSTNLPNDELGTVCKKPYSISMLGVKKQ